MHACMYVCMNAYMHACIHACVKHTHTEYVGSTHTESMYHSDTVTADSAGCMYACGCVIVS